MRSVELKKRGSKRDPKAGTRHDASPSIPDSPFRTPHSPAPPRPPQAQSDSQPARAVTGKLPVILAITGASGAPYGVRLLEMLAVHHVPTWLLVSSHGWRLLTEECGIKDDREQEGHRGRVDE